MSTELHVEIFPGRVHNRATVFIHEGKPSRVLVGEFPCTEIGAAALGGALGAIADKITSRRAIVRTFACPGADEFLLFGGAFDALADFEVEAVEVSA